MTITATANCNNISFGNPASGALTFAGSSALNVFGNFTITADITRTYIGTITFSATTTGKTITTNGETIGGATVFNGVGGEWTFQDDYNAGVQAMTLTNGSLVTNGKTVTSGSLSSNNSNVRSLTLGASTWVLRSTGTIWNFATTTNLTLDVGTSTLQVNDVGASSKTFAGGGKTYNDLKILGGGAGAVIITGANTFNRIYTDGGGTKSITLPGSTTTTLLSGVGLGNGTNVITFTASAGSATVSKSSGTVSWDYVSLTNIPSAGGATFYAGANSTDGGGNTGWSFTAGVVSYEIIAAAGSFALTGIDSTFSIGRTLVAAAGSFTLTGVDVVYSRGIRMVADVGSFVLTGVSSGLSIGRTLVAAAGSFVLTGQDSLFARSVNMVAAAGSFALSGVDATFNRAVNLVCDAGSFVLSGVSASFSGSGSWRFSNTSKSAVSSFTNQSKGRRY